MKMNRWHRWLVCLIGLFGLTGGYSYSNPKQVNEVRQFVVPQLSTYIDDKDKVNEIFDFIMNPSYASTIDCDDIVSVRSSTGGVWVTYIPDPSDAKIQPIMRMFYLDSDNGLSVLHITKGSCSIRNQGRLNNR